MPATGARRRAFSWSESANAKRTVSGGGFVRMRSSPGRGAVSRVSGRRGDARRPERARDRIEGHLRQRELIRGGGHAAVVAVRGGELRLDARREDVLELHLIFGFQIAASIVARTCPIQPRRKNQRKPDRTKNPSAA